MIPSAETIIAAIQGEFPGVSLSEKAIRAAIQHARELARGKIDEPAAIFFTFAIRPRAVPALNASLASFLAHEQARSLGIPSLNVARQELRDMQRRCRMREMSFEDIRAWFAERLPVN